MIVSKYVELKINTANIKNLKDKGYENLVYNTSTQVKVEDLTLGSHVRIDCKCFHCKNITNVVYKNYNITTKNNTEDYYCKDCGKYRVKKNNLEKYGVECTLQLQSTKDKIKENNIERYGVEHYSQTNEYKEKVKITNLERYGVEYYLQTEDKQIKSKKTCIDKYGTEYANQSDIVKDKMKAKNLELYDREYYSQTPMFIEQMKTSNIENYGDEVVLNNHIIREKYNKTRNDNIFEKINNLLNSKTNDYELLSYDNNWNIEIKHLSKNHIFKIYKGNLSDRLNFGVNICTCCYPIGEQNSIKEKEFTIWLENFNIPFSKNRTILKGKELDVYIPSHNLAIEFNGLYWHSELFKEKNYHLSKSLKCQDNNIHLMHIWEDELVYKLEIVKSIILNKLNKIENKIFARKCSIKEVKDSKLVRQFLDDNHIQGYSQSSIKLGLYYNNELVSLMTFGYRHTNKKKEFELIRFCNILNTNVIGASSKLFKYFLNNYSENNILSYSDFRLFDGKMYETLGFEKIHLSNPDYFWCKGINRFHRFNFNKQKLVEQGFDKNKTEVEIMHERGYYRIWSCGQVRWEFNK